MQLTDILTPECIKVPLSGEDKRSVVDELVDLLAGLGRIDDAAAVKHAVWQREQTRTTGIGHGLAIPHGKSTGATQLVMAIGRAPRPIEYGSIDGRPVSLIFMLASPPDQTGPHIQILAKISRLMTRADVRAAMLAATEAQAIYDLIAREEKVGVQ
jgi:fructose-specific phosphotransferase system IIA component